MSELVRPIAVVQGAASEEIQSLLWSFAVSLRRAVRVVGVIEETPASGDAQLRSLVDDRIFPLFQDLGPRSTACSLDSESLTMACEAVRRDIAGGCDLVVLSKFGKLEAEEGAGLAGAFAAAVEARTPVLTSVAPKFDARWRAFADPLFVLLPPDAQALRGWWERAAALAV